MSIDRCGCGRLVDTDFDLDFYENPEQPRCYSCRGEMFASAPGRRDLITVTPQEFFEALGRSSPIPRVIPRG